MTKKFFPFIILLMAVFCWYSCDQLGPAPKVLVFTKTSGHRHASIEAGIAAIEKLGNENGFEVEATEDSTLFSEEKLVNYAAVIFLNTSGDVLNNWQQADFQRYIEAGGGFAGIHAAATTEYDWRWYGRLVGAYFDHHPEIQEAEITVVDPEHPATEQLPALWKRTDEWYNFRPVLPAGKVLAEVPDPLGQAAEKDSLSRLVNNVVPDAAWSYEPGKPFLSPAIKVLLSLDEKSFTGGIHGDSHPIAWYQEFEGGRSFYTGLGHATDSFSDSLFLLHLLGGIKYAIGDGHLDYTKVKTKRIPPQDRFVRTVIASNLNEPTEMAVFPDGKVMVVERRGAIKLYDPEKDTMEVITYLPVYSENESGLMGVQLDPDWANNQWVYLFYSVYEGPVRPVYVADGSYHQGRLNRLSRFVFDGKMLHMSSEKILLEVPEMIGCCHTGGSIDFDSKGNLFLSTGDNTNPFESDGFGPFDERPGRALWDAQKSAANTNDLRGKILRIKPEADGSYTIPEGNLFPPGMEKTRPEIFVMGCRNPYRIAVDKSTDCVYWGDVGPDAGKDGVQRGSKGYDFWGRACEPGNYGWPLFRGNHIYYDYNFATRKSSGLFNPENPLNNSPNNSGKQELPPLQPPLIWYSYDESYEFPWLGTGGKNPMAGPVFHAETIAAQDSERPQTLFPDYFENKFFIYEWMRHWIYVITVDENGQFVQADPFLPDEKFSRPMDMAFGPDGALYVLEYGEQWFAQNPDARLNRIEFAPGNRRPVARFSAEPVAGAVPLQVKFSAAASVDYDGDPLQYEWIVNKGAVASTSSRFEYQFTRPGTYEVELRVKDPSGATSRARTEIAAGNAPPSVAWQLEGNQTFYWDNRDIHYQVNITDPEDGSLRQGSLDVNRVKISIDYLAEGKDLAAIAMGHQTKESSGTTMKYAGGRLLIEKNDCKTCHDVDRKINGPSYIDIANRYYGDAFAVKALSEKVIRGGAGNWGETAMSAHPNLSRDESEEIVRYILSLSGEMQIENPIPFEGVFLPEEHIGREEKGAYIFQASYRDKGRDNGEGTLYARQTLVLRYPKMEAESYDAASPGIRRIKDAASGASLVTDIVNGRYIGYRSIDLSGIEALVLGFSEEDNMPKGTEVEIRLDSPSGKIAGKLNLIDSKTPAEVTLPDVKGKHDVYLVFKNEKLPDANLPRLDWIFFEKEKGEIARQPHR